ncbi:MAG: DJ-1/PfpI family protein [Oscillospiraceae bacterium]|jgi:4-methyl-5(b-hydroxyethyl)-thiazole monophosphate biosynthesis|nr:DJ-1/PfpI family protein [Oscillospiraceae bacterium]
MIYLFLAEGFEELEAIAPADCLRRAGLDLCLVGIGGRNVKSCRGIEIVCDYADSEVFSYQDAEMIVLPGGMPGTLNLEKSETVQSAVDFCVQSGKYIAAICAAPSVLGRKGVLKGHKAVCYPGFEDQLQGAEITGESVCVSGKFITAKSAGAALEFGLELVRIMCSKTKSENIAGAMYVK